MSNGKRKKRPPPSLPPLPANGDVRERKIIEVAYYWPNEGYGCGTRFESYDAAMSYAQKCAPDAESTGRAVMHIIETHTKTTVVRP